MTKKPIIGINADFRSAAHNQPAFSYVAAGYFDAITNAGGIPVILAPTTNSESLGQLLDHLDGCVLIGGADLDPRNDGYMLHASVKPMDARREQFDRLLAREIFERRLPVLAIMQACSYSMSLAVATSSCICRKISWLPTAP